MSNPSRSAPQRRRSSIAYDPARDTFTEIPDTIPEDAIVDNVPGSSLKDTAVTLGSPAQESDVMNGGTKRRRSVSAEPKSQKGPTQATGSKEPTPKKARRSPDGDGASQAESKPISPKSTSQPAPRTVADLPRVPRRNREEGEVSTTRPTPSAYSRRPDTDRYRPNSRRSPSPNQRSPTSLYRRRSPPRHRERSRSVSPIRRSPPRDPVVRPGGVRGRGRNVLAEQQRLAAERERQSASLPVNVNRGLQDISNQFYNTRPEWVREKGRDWRRNESQIKGLRSFNNWIKSCVIQKFSPVEKAEPEEVGWGEEAKEPEEQKPLLVLDIGCGKGGDLGKWQLAPQQVGLYVGLDPAETSIRQAQDRYSQMRRGRKPIFDARFATQDCFGEWIGEVPIVREVGIDGNAGNGTISRFGGGGFDVVTMMFSMHYAFESEEKVRTMLRNVAGSLKKGGRFVGVVPNSDMLAERIRTWYAKRKQPTTNGNAPQHDDDAATRSPKEEGEMNKEEDNDDAAPSWGNSIYSVRFPSASSGNAATSPDGTFRPPFAWKYTYWMAEAVDVPEFVVPWEAFRALAEGFNLEQRYRKPFLDIWDSERRDREMSALADRMGVTRRDGSGGEPKLAMSAEEKEAVAFYHAFCFVKV